MSEQMVRKTAYNEKCGINGNVWCPCRRADAF